MAQATTGASPVPRIPAGDLEHLTLREARTELECYLIRERLIRHHGDLDAAAQSLGVSRSRLYELIRQYDLAEPAAARKDGIE
jgi:DNA-binding NtrC family response regulator